VIRVLVVDDDFMVAKVHSSVVARQPGYQVVGVVHSAAAALEAVRTLHPDLVLLDVYLPDMSGLDVLRRLRERAPGQVDVIVISAARDIESIRRALHGGVFHYLVKPFEIDSLRQRLVEFSDHRAELRDLDEAAEMRQDDVDRAFRAQSGQARRLPKSISPETVEVVETALRGVDGDADGMSAMECADATGLSRSSTRRYLDHLVETGAAELLPPRYGAAGRPERRYRVRSR
jgi:response regulator of citrate/malate metabolism